MQKERPGVTFLVFDAKQSPTDNFNTWSAQVKAHPDALAYVGPGSQAAVSLSRIQRKPGAKKLLVGACDLDQVAMEGVSDGYVEALDLPRALAQGLPRDQADGRRQAERQGAAGGHVELRRADRQQGQHRRDHRPPEGPGSARRLLQGRGRQAARRPGPVPRPDARVH